MGIPVEKLNPLCRERLRKRLEQMEKSREKGVQLKQQNGLGLVGKRGGGTAAAGPSTPSPTWRLEMFPSHSQDGNHNSAKQFLTDPPNNSAVSARKLCATLWEIQPQRSLSLTKMGKTAPKPRRKVKIDRVLDFAHPDVKPDQFQIANGADLPRCELRGNELTISNVSSASYASSMEVAPYKQPHSPMSSLKGPVDASSDSPKTSSELLKILNRIWTLEEQHQANTSLMKALKMELLCSQAKIKDLVQDKQKEKQIIKELGEERKLREYSDVERGKLSKELSVLKSGFSTALKELERERKARVLLESLCDEFAKGVRDYDLVLRSLKHKLAEDSFSGENLDHSVLHISEAWLDERMQMKQARGLEDVSEKDMIVDRLSPEIETFLQAKQSVEKMKGNGSKGRQSLCRHSLESFALNESTSAPQFVDEHSVGSDIHGKDRKQSSRKDTENLSSIEAKRSQQNGSNRRVGSTGFRSLSLKGDQIHRRSHRREISSPVQQWKFNLSLPDDIRESDLSLKLPLGIKENTLMAKLLEARLESQHSRLKARASV